MASPRSPCRFRRQGVGPRFNKGRRASERIYMGVAEASRRGWRSVGRITDFEQWMRYHALGSRLTSTRPATARAACCSCAVASTTEHAMLSAFEWSGATVRTAGLVPARHPQQLITLRLASLPGCQPGDGHFRGDDRRIRAACSAARIRLRQCGTWRISSLQGGLWLQGFASG